MCKPNRCWLALAVCVIVVAQAASAGPLRTSATTKGLFVGAAVNMTPFRNEPIYSETLRRESITTVVGRYRGKIQSTGGVAFSGQYSTVGGAITQSHTTTSTAVTYQFSLTAGQTLGPSTSRVFAAQTSGSGAVHPTAGDTYTVTYTAGGQSFTRSGGF
jgi:hypothetical protein